MALEDPGASFLALQLITEEAFDHLAVRTYERRVRQTGEQGNRVLGPRIGGELLTTLDLESKRAG
jgi:hypothetical protein